MIRAALQRPDAMAPVRLPARPAATGKRSSNQRLQAKLRIGPVDDPLEREADAVADALVQGEPARPVRAGAQDVVRRDVLPASGAKPGSPPAPVVDPSQPLVTTMEVDTKTDAKKFGKGMGEAAGAAMDTAPGKALQDAASALFGRDWSGAPGGGQAALVAAAVFGLAGVGVMKAIPDADDAPPTPEKTPRIKISKNFKVQLGMKLGWSDKAPDGTETPRRTPRIDAVTVSLFYDPKSDEPADPELVAKEIARLQAALARFNPKVGDEGFAASYAAQRMAAEGNRRPSWLPSEEEIARQRAAERVKLDAGPFGARPRPGLRLLPDLELAPMPAPGTVQRKCAAGADAHDDDETVRLKPAGAGAGSADAAVAGLGVGAPLPASERGFFEGRFGRNFSDVRIHPESAGASAIGARAFTLDRDIAFAPGEWRPGAEAGRRLLAHELVHVVQQDRGAAPIVRREPAESTAGTSVWGDLTDVFRPSRWRNARACLTELFEPMHSITFDRWIAHACARTGRGELHAREWDAFGHCWIGCEGTRQCGGPQTWTYGLGRELQREWHARTGGEPHDSLLEDIANQLIGRASSVRDGTCFSVCDGLHAGGWLRLTAPVRTCMTCNDLAGGEHPCRGGSP